MARPNVRITLEKGNVDVGVLIKGVRVEVRNYDTQGIGNRKQLWTDEQGKRCFRYFVSSEVSQDAAHSVADDLERFADDLQTHAGVSAILTPDSCPDGLHTLAINGVDFYFGVESGGYDGWGKAITPDASGGQS